MGILRAAKKGMALALVSQLLLTTQMATMAQAEMLSTEAAIDKYASHADRGYLMDALQRDDVQAAMIQEGVDPAEAEARLAALSDAEVEALVMQMRNETAGADIVGTLFTVFVILLVTDILCFTRIFSFTRCAR
ncbi:PA2779 family protein [Loktanella sp. S4079]|uniref:PA2779 family protein n=1 Tax=Loktanella sp. S4079 TaxID=579483 RepID=UPI0005F9DAAA|nr:PA2779 family protein [Loktanella sp. S4079]KJZ21105.1 hypothetical protein TW80_00100 [Loktanella sp. S4079]